MSAVTANIARRVKEDMFVCGDGLTLLIRPHACSCRYYQAQNEAARQRFIAGGIASWHEHQERKVAHCCCRFLIPISNSIQGGNTRQLLQKEIEEEHRAAAVELVLRRRSMIKELYSREAQQYR